MRPATPPSPALAFRLNGRTMSVEGVTPRQNLLDYIRGLGLTGAKEGCAEGECGACTVVLVKQNGEGSEYRAVYTVESLANCPP